MSDFARCMYTCVPMMLDFGDMLPYMLNGSPHAHNSELGWMPTLAMDAYTVDSHWWL